MKKLAAAACLTGVALLVNLPGIARGQGAPGASGPGAPSAKYDYPSGMVPQFIVTYRGARSLDAELGVMRERMRPHARDDGELARMVAARRGLLEAELASASRSRVAELRASMGMEFEWRRVLATGSDLIRFDPKRRGMGVGAFMRRLERHPAVEAVEFDAMMKPLFTPNDEFYGAQWHYYEATAGINAEAAWDVSTGAGATVAVLDTGHRPHVDLIGNIIGGYDFISDSSRARDGNGRDPDAEDEGDWTSGECGPSSGSSWHGTHVSGTIGAVTDNGTGVAGVAFDAGLLSVRVLGRCGGTLSDIADAIVWSAGGSVAGVPDNPNPADVINMSLGGGGSCGSTYQNAIDTAVANGAVVVVAAGNSNTNASNARPANCANVVTVAALDRGGNRANYSNYGSLVDVAAPGGETSPTASNGVASTLNAGSTTPGSDNYVYYQGTSMATPHVAGIAALMISQDPSLTPAQVESLLESTARPLPGSCSGGCGAGLVDAAAAVAAVGGGGGGGGDGVLTNGEVVSGLSGATGAWDYFTIELPAGASNLSVSISGGSGDADLYVRFGAQPTLSSYDCRPWLNGNSETCTFATPGAGTWHIGLNGYASYASVTLTASFDEPAGGGGSCSVDFDFESGASGWSNGSSATCSTGSFVLGTPGQQSSGGVVTQVGGDHTTGTGNAAYTASNSSAGNADVDGGQCVLESPVWSVPSASTLEAWYFFGQRDTGDDPAGDFFVLELSTNGGSSYTPIVSIGDTATSAAWTKATASVPAGSNVKLRMRVSDGAGPGDIVEGGLDDITICN